MLRPPTVSLLCLVALLSCPSWSDAQPADLQISKSFRLESFEGGRHLRATGAVEAEQGDMRFSADVADYYRDEDLLVASGNVVFVSGDSRIAADRIEFNTRTRTGTFHNAWGAASIADRVDRSMFGTQEPDAYFYGELVEKLGPKKYRVSRGAFTTCVQPTPRWEIVSSSATITLDEYAILRNSVLRVKGVPLFYLPIMYYPIQEDDRATGFLIPTYGASTVRGQSLSNAFFWAIDRSQDATFFHDWFTQTGQGLGGEYRYVAAPGSEGYFRSYWLNEREATFTSGGVERATPARRSYEVRASAIQRLPGNLRARGNVDYFSDVTVQQLYQANLYEASRRQRAIGGNVAGSWGANAFSATVNLNEVFYGDTDSALYGGAPRVGYTRAARPILGAPLYFSAGTEFVSLVQRNRSGGVEIDRGLHRLAIGPGLRLPLSRWPFLSINSSVGWNLTYYSESLDEQSLQVPEPVWRNYVDMRTEFIGPVFNRIFSTPGNRYAERFKHVIEPAFNIQRVTQIDNYDRIPKLESYDYTYGGTTRMAYGLTNRLLARRRTDGQAREVLNASVWQTWYSDPRASQFDPAYASSFLGRAVSNFSPVMIGLRSSPTEQINGSLRIEYDHDLGEILSTRASGAFGWREWLQTTAGWSRRRIDATRSDNYFNAGTNLHLRNGRLGGHYNFDYDFFRSRLMQQRVLAFYNAQCCGVVVEYQTFNFVMFDPRFPVPRDRRINISFTLAGVGTFSNPFGSFGAGTGQRR
jgi:LPS-assembly protein